MPMQASAAAAAAALCTRRCQTAWLLKQAAHRVVMKVTPFHLASNCGQCRCRGEESQRAVCSSCSTGGSSSTAQQKQYATAAFAHVHHDAAALLSLQTRANHHIVDPAAMEQHET